MTLTWIALAWLLISPGAALLFAACIGDADRRADEAAETDHVPAGWAA